MSKNIYSKEYWKQEAKKFTDKSKVLQLPWEDNEVQKNARLTSPHIYLWSTYYPASILKNIAKEVSLIYEKQKQVNGQSLNVQLSIIEPEVHLKKAYGRYDAWAEIKYLDSHSRNPGDETVMRLSPNKKELETYWCKVYAQPSINNGWDLIYVLGYNTAHEVLHQWLSKSIFYVYGAESYRAYRNDKLISSYGDSEGHYNGSDVTYKAQNLNMAGETLGDFRPTHSSSKLRRAERIVSIQYQLLINFFYRYGLENGDKRTSRKLQTEN